MDNDLYHLIKNLKRVSGFLGSKGIPVPVSDKENRKNFRTNKRWCSSAKIWYRIQHW